MERSKLRRCTGMRLSDLDTILGELANEGKITQLPLSTGKEMIIQKDR
jgi:hypothetical protein